MQAHDGYRYLGRKMIESLVAVALDIGALRLAIWFGIDILVDRVWRKEGRRRGECKFLFMCCRCIGR